MLKEVISTKIMEEIPALVAN